MSILAAAVIAATLVGAVVGLHLVQRPRLVRSRIRSRFVVTLKSGAAFEGALYEADSEAWVLRGVQALGAGENDSNVPVDGELVVLVADIAYAQKPT